MNRTSLIQTLEPRRHLSVTLGSDGLLAVTGTRSADVVALAIYQGQLHVNLNGQTTLFDPEDVVRIEIRTGRGNDIVKFGKSFSAIPFPAGIGEDEETDPVMVPVMVVTAGGNDYAEVEGSASRVFAGPGDDNIQTMDGNDFVDGGAGDDSIRSFRGLDTLDGGDGDDFIRGGADADVLTGGDGNDRLFGEEGRDVLRAGAGQDGLDGGADADTLHGGTGNDRMIGGGGVDELFGGNHGDTFLSPDGPGERKDFSLAGGDVLNRIG
jgi:Ca2+-binding RTX toxin-like protein